MREVVSERVRLAFFRSLIICFLRVRFLSERSPGGPASLHRRLALGNPVIHAAPRRRGSRGRMKRQTASTGDQGKKVTEPAGGLPLPVLFVRKILDATCGRRPAGADALDGRPAAPKARWAQKKPDWRKANRAEEKIPGSVLLSHEQTPQYPHR